MSIHSLREQGEAFLNATPQDNRKKRKSILRGWLITGIFLGICVGIVLYFMLRPERFPVVYQIQGNELTSPANGEIRFLAPAGKMEKGALIAEVLVPPESGGTLLEQAHLLQDRLRNIREEERQDAERIAEMHQNVERFLHEQKRTEADLRLVRQSRSQCLKILDMQQKRRDSARRLFQLEAIRNSELSNAEEQYDIAADELKKTELEIQKNEILLASIQKSHSAGNSGDCRRGTRFRTAIEIESPFPAAVGKTACAYEICSGGYAVAAACRKWRCPLSRLFPYRGQGRCGRNSGAAAFGTSLFAACLYSRTFCREGGGQ